MKDILVAYKTASLLKEVDFNEITDYYYPIGSIEPIRTIDYWNMYDSTVACPTQSLAQKWLREVHSFHVEVISNFYNRKPLLGYIYMLNRFINGVHDGINYDSDQLNTLGKKNTFPTYEEALEAGIQAALKYLKNK